VNCMNRTAAAAAPLTRFSIWTLCAAVFFCLAGILATTPAAGRPIPGQDAPSRTKVAEGDYEISEQAGDGVLETFESEVYDFHESWTLWRVEKGQYRIEGVRKFESPKGDPHSNRFTVELSRDLTVLRVTEFAKLRWVRDSGPLSCEFLRTHLDCSSGGSDPKRELKMQTRLEEPYGILWPVSPFSFTGIVRQVERDRNRPTRVQLVRIEQPGRANPVQAMVLEGPLQYLGAENIEIAGRKWLAHKFSLKVPMNPEYLIWTSAKGLLLALSVQHEHLNWREEGIRLASFESSEAF